MADRIYPKGFLTFAKNENAPDWVLGNLNLDVTALAEWLKGEGKQYLEDYKGNKRLRLNIIKGKDGRVQFSVNTWGKEQAAQEQKPAQHNPAPSEDEIPF